MGNSVHSPKDIVRERSLGLCEKCGCVLTKNVEGVPDGDTARTVHHRQPRRAGGKDTVANMVHICNKCHTNIHRDEAFAATQGWIVIGDYPEKVPFLSYHGWLLPGSDGSLMLLDFDRGKAVDLAPAPVMTSRRKRVAHRQRHRSSRVKAGLRDA